MEWRCSWCCKPHEGNDPPCEACGHWQLERAIVRMAPEKDGGAFLWVCGDCERIHPKNSPPCDRCGAMGFGKRVPDDLDVEADLEVPGYLELTKSHYRAVLVGVVVLGIIASGVVALPAPLRPSLGPPTIEDTPGDAVRASGIDLREVERLTLGRLNDVRERDGRGRLQTDETLEAMAEFDNRRRVIRTFEDREVDGSLGEFDPSCGGTIQLGQFGLRYTTDERPPIESVRDEAGLARVLAASFVADPAFENALLDARSSVGLDVHVAPNGHVYAGMALC